MTKTVRDNFDGVEVDADDAWEFMFKKRINGVMTKVEGDISEHGFLNLYKGMVKQPRYQKYIKATDEEKKKDPSVYGHWEKL